MCAALPSLSRLVVSSPRTWLMPPPAPRAVAFAARTSVGDPPFIHNDKRLAEIPTRKYADAVRANITDVRRPSLASCGRTPRADTSRSMVEPSD